MRVKGQTQHGDDAQHNNRKFEARTRVAGILDLIKCGALDTQWHEGGGLIDVVLLISATWPGLRVERLGWWVILIDVTQPPYPGTIPVPGNRPACDASRGLSRKRERGSNA